ncbi:MAG: NAD-dependent epimerase/dehydratase family protein [Methanobacteriota archaeon]|nr:MAG: NAD-dependent epimerase/dehydratase family protein [Euryarchaeota archaeon]
MLRGKRVAVTGGAGFIGSHVVERLAPSNDVVVLDNLTTGRLENLAGVRDRVDVVQGSILDPEAVRRAFGGADTVFHLAALTSVPESIEKPLPYAETNATGTLNVLAGAREAGVRRLVFASSCAVYGRATGSLKEDLPPDPLSPYAVTKLASEYFLRVLSGDGLETVALRLFNVYGPRQAPDSPYSSVVARFVRSAATGTPLTLHGDGRQTRDFVFVSDIAEAFERAATSRGAGGGLFNVGSGRETSILDLIEALRPLAGASLKVVREPRRAGDIRSSRADTRRAARTLGFRARTSLKEGLRRTLEAARLTSS